jgi:beta-mannosidase
MTVGPWKPIKLEAYSTRIADVDVRVDVSQDLDAQLDAQIAFSGAVTGTAVVELKNPAGEVVHSEPLAVRDANVAHYKQTFASNELQLWYPVGYGKQPLYSLHVTLLNEVGWDALSLGDHWLTRRCRVAPFWMRRPKPLLSVEFALFRIHCKIRRGRLGCSKSTTSVYSAVVCPEQYPGCNHANSRPPSGSNWIPADSFLTTLVKTRVRAVRLLNLLSVSLNQDTGRGLSSWLQEIKIWSGYGAAEFTSMTTSIAFATVSDPRRLWGRKLIYLML